MEGSALTQIGLPLALFIIMVGMGVSLTVADFRRVAEQPKGVAVGTALQLFGIPALGFAIGYFAGGGMLAVGLVLVAALPGGTTSNVICYLARANLALSITLTVIASLVTILTLPVYVNWALQAFVGEGTELHLSTVKTLITLMVIVVIPVGLGMLLKRIKPNAATRVEPIINVFSIVVLISIIVAILVVERDNVGSWMQAAWLPVLALNLGALAIGLIAGKLSGLVTADTLTTAVEVSIKNTTLGITIAVSLLGSSELALPSAVYGLMMYASAVALAVYGRRVAARKY